MYQIYGFTGAVHTCLDVAIDGYTVFGHPLVYAIDDKMETSVLKKDAADDDTMTNVEFVLLEPYKTTIGDVAPGNTDAKGVNQGQIRAIVEILDSTLNYHCAVFTSSEYYHESSFMCFAGAAASIIDDATTTIKAAATADIFTKAAYGSVWNGYCYEAAEAVANTAIVAQAPDYCMFVGTR